MSDDNSFEPRKLEDGEEYLTVVLDTKTVLSKAIEAISSGEQILNFGVFPNNNYSSPKSPAFTAGRWCSVWKNVKKGGGDLE